MRRRRDSKAEFEQVGCVKDNCKQEKNCGSRSSLEENENPNVDIKVLHMASLHERAE